MSLGELIDLTTSEAREELLGKLVGDWLTLLALMVFEELHALEGSGAGDELVGELALIVRVVIASILIVHLLVILLSVICCKLISNDHAVSGIE